MLADPTCPRLPSHTVPEKYRFLIRFSILIVGLYVVIALNPVNDHVIVPYTTALAKTVTAVMKLGGAQVTTHDTIIYSPLFATDIKNGCNGVEAAVLLIAAIGAFRAPASSRVIGIAVGLLFIQVVNVIRLVLLFWVGEHFRTLFDLMHIVVWQIVIIVASVLFFVAWSSRVGRPSAAA